MLRFVLDLTCLYCGNVGKISKPYRYGPFESCKEGDKIPSRYKWTHALYRWTDNLEVVGHSDSAFAGYVDSRKSISRYIFIFAGGAVFWRSTK